MASRTGNQNNIEDDTTWTTVKVAYLTEEGFSWITFQERLRERFYPSPLKWQKQQEFLKFNQGNLRVQEYTNKFIELSRFDPHIILTEEEKARKYEKGLKFNLQKLLGGTFSKTFEEAYEREMNLQHILDNEETLFNKGKERDGGESSHQVNYDKKPRYDNRNNNNGGGNNNYHGNNYRGHQRFKRGNSLSRIPYPDICKGCNNPIYPGRTCKGDPLICHEYKGLGHKATQCPSRLGGGGQVRGVNFGGRGPRNNKWQGSAQGFNRQVGYCGNQGYQHSGSNIASNTADATNFNANHKKPQ
ncbi:Lipoprotein-releasing system ATP-binding protein LolD [Bienertia sinuspersici]